MDLKISWVQKKRSGKKQPEKLASFMNFYYGSHTAILSTYLTLFNHNNTRFKMNVDEC